MKNSSIVGLIVAAVAILQGCAGTVNPEKKSTATLLTGSEKLSLSSKECPRGISMIRLYNDTLDGQKTKFNAKVGITTKAIESEINVYSLIGESTIAEGFSKSKSKGPVKKPEIDTSLNSIEFTLSDKVVNPEGKAATAELNKSLAIRLDPKDGYYHNWGEVTEVALGDHKKNQKILNSVNIALYGAGSEVDYSLPETLEIPASTEVGTSEAPKATSGGEEKKPEPQKINMQYSAEVGKPLVIDVLPKKSEAVGLLWAQFQVRNKGGTVNAYNYVVKEGPGISKLEIPTKEIKPGKYTMNVFRTEITRIPTDDGKNSCLDLTTGFMGVVEVKAPPPPAR